jgi:hypothetical protein
VSTPVPILRGDAAELRSVLAAGHAVFLETSDGVIGLEPYPAAGPTQIATHHHIRGRWYPGPPLFLSASECVVRLSATADGVRPVFSEAGFGYTTLDAITDAPGGGLAIGERAYGEEWLITPRAFGVGYDSAVAAVRRIAYEQCTDGARLPLHVRSPGYAYAGSASETIVRDATGAIYRIRPAREGRSRVYDLAVSELAQTDVEFETTVHLGEHNNYIFGEGGTHGTAPLTEVIDVIGRVSGRPLACEFNARVGRLLVRELHPAPGR